MTSIANKVLVVFFKKNGRNADMYNKAFSKVKKELENNRHFDLENKIYRRDKFAYLFIPGRLKRNNEAFTIK